MITERERVLTVLGDLQRLCAWEDTPWLEHSVDPTIVAHEFTISVPPQTTMNRVVVYHPEGCGCDALPTELYIHG